MKTTTLTKKQDGYAYAIGRDKFIVKMVDGWPNAHHADVSIEPPDNNGKILARVSIGNINDSKLFDTFAEAEKFVDQFINPVPTRRLSEWIKANGRLIVAKYDGTDCLGDAISAGENIYFAANQNNKLTLKSE